MDPEIKEEFVAVRADIRNVDERVREIDGHLREVDTRLSADIRRVEVTLRQEIREEGVATRRHFDVVAESLRDDIRLIAQPTLTSESVAVKQGVAGNAEIFSGRSTRVILCGSWR